MNPKTIEKNFNCNNIYPMDAIHNFAASYHFGNSLQQAVAQQQQQQFALNAMQAANVLTPDYAACRRVSASVSDVNNNYGVTPSNYASALNYFNDTNLSNSSNNNNNNNAFPNQNYKNVGKYAASSTICPSTLQNRTLSAVSASSMINNPSCQYAYTYGGTSCYNRNRYMPYNHNRACAAAAATISVGMNSRPTPTPLINSITVSNTLATSTAAAPLNYSSYKQLAPNITNYPPGITANVATSTVALETANAALMTAAYEQGIATTVTDYERYTLNALQSSIAATVAEASVGCPNVQAALNYVTAPTATTTAAGSIASSSTSTSSYASVTDLSQAVSLRLSNLDYTMDEESLRNFVLTQLKPITPVVSLTFEESNFATLTVPDSYFAKQVVANLHRKKIGHKRMVVSYTRDSSLTEASTLRCQVAGLLKDVPYNRLPMYKFRELFQSRFKTSISVLDLYTMRDICIIGSDGNDEKFITLQPNLVNSMEISPLMEGTQHTVPYCTEHFKREQHKGWAEQEIEPLPNVLMSIAEIQNIIYPLLKNHHGDIPISTLLHCFEGEMNVKIQPNESGVNLEHLVCCVQGVKVQMNTFGIKILGWFDADKRNSANSTGSCASSVASLNERGQYFKSADPLSQITREVIELVKMSPKSTMKFSRFIPAYHNHFGRQCRVADYGYTKLIELFEALSGVVQIMGDGENRQITLTHRTQIRRFTSDLLRVLRTAGNKSVLLSELPKVFTEMQHRTFNISDYGVCNIRDILDGLVNSNVVVVSKVQNGKDILISIPKRQQSQAEVAKTCVFAGEIVELFQNAPQYTILFQKFVRSYHYHFAYQCRLSDYGFLKLADLMEAIHGVVEMDRNNDEGRRIFLSPQIARRVFAEQCAELIRVATGSSKTSIKLEDVLKLHKKKYGYQIQAETLGVHKIINAMEVLPYVEIFEEDGQTWIICHNEDPIFRTLCYRVCKHLLAYDPLKYSAGANIQSSNENNSSGESKRKPPSLENFIIEFNAKFKENLNVNTVKAMRFAIEIYTHDSRECVRISKFIEFVIKLVRLLEQRTILLLSEIKSTTNCTISTTFAFGYPNLYTLLTAYPDIFTVNTGVSQDSSEVRLAPNCELSVQRSFHTIQKLATNAGKQLQPKTNLSRPARPPLAERNGPNLDANYNGAPLAKLRHIMPPETNANIPPAASVLLNDSKSLITSNPNVLNHAINNNNSNNPYQSSNILAMNGVRLQSQKSINGHSFSSSYGSYNSAANYSTSHNSSLLNCSLSNISGNANKENSLNGSFNLTGTFNSSAASLSDLSSSLIGSSALHLSSSVVSGSNNFNNNKNNGCNNSKLWERRQDNSSYYRQQTNQLMSDNTESTFNFPPSLKVPNLPSSNALITQSGLYSLVDSIQNGPPGTPMFDPPKPDTPPSHNMPFWIDPVWSQGSNAKPKNELLCIKPRIGQNSDQLPIVLSPYTLSKIVNMKKVFNFECQNREMA